METQTVTNLNNFLFIGDSFTSRIKNTIQSKAKDSYVRAKGGAFPSYWLDNFSQMPDSNNVKGIVLLIGINGISRESNLTDTKTINRQNYLKNIQIKQYMSKESFQSERIRRI